MRVLKFKGRTIYCMLMYIHNTQNNLESKRNNNMLICFTVFLCNTAIKWKHYFFWFQKHFAQSCINIGSDRTWHRPLFGLGSKWGPQLIFWGHFLVKYYKTEHKVQKNMRITVKKNIMGPKFFSPGRAPKFLNLALPLRTLP